MNSAALRFVPVSKLEAEGYGQFLRCSRPGRPRRPSTDPGPPARRLLSLSVTPPARVPAASTIIAAKLRSPTRAPLPARILAAMPPRLGFAVGALLGRLLYLVSGHYRRHTRANLELAFPGATLRRRLAVSAGAGRCAVEGVHVLVRPPAETAPRVRDAPGWEAVASALDAGHGVLLLSAHQGCFEIFGPAFVDRAMKRAREPPEAVLCHAFCFPDWIFDPANGRDGRRQRHPA